MARCRAFALTAISLLLSTSALAQSPVDEGRRLFEAADFYGALEVLARAEEGSALDLPLLVRLYETRILVHLALGEEGGIERDLAALATIAPEHGFAPEMPPAVRTRFGALLAERAGRLDVEVSREATDGGVRLDARASGDPLGLVRAVRLHARVGGGRWISAQSSLELGAEPGELIEWHADLVGPGGAVLASRGARRAPMSFTVGGTIVVADDGAGAPWVWIAIGGVAVIAIGVVAIVALSGGDDSQTGLGTAIDGPFVMGF
jgi:hypothetical protein